MPESATVSDIAEVYAAGWKMGLKALAVYRDNCKVGQPLSAGNSARTDESAEATAAPVEHRPVRKRLPKVRDSKTLSFSVGGAEGYMTAAGYPDGGLGEIFLKMSKQGSTLAGMMDAFSIAISIGLQYGVPLETYVQKFTNMRFEPAGMTDDPDVRMAASIMDYIFRRLALDYMPPEERAALGIHTAEERARQLETGSYFDDSEAVQGSAGEDPIDTQALAQSAPIEPADATVGGASATWEAPGSTTELLEAQQGRTADAPLCLTCGTKMRAAGSCYVCEGCGSTSGCS
jgi:ribonucleoside-diphosphate reductase alpha chain